MKTVFTILMTAIVAATATWLGLRSDTHDHSHHLDHAGSQVLYYQSAMHPWIKSDKPGRCTICGMELTPVYAGEQGLEASEKGNLVTLSRTQVQVLNPGTSQVKMAPLIRNLSVAGTITNDSTRIAVLSAYTDFRIDKLHVNYVGAEVKAGQPLAEIYSPTILQATREYRQLSGDLREKAALRLKQFGLTDVQIRAIPEQPEDTLVTQILAPLGGTVVVRNIREGQYVSSGQALFEIADFSRMWFLFDAYEQNLPWIRIGQEVAITAPSLPGHQFSGKVVFINPNVNSLTRSIPVRVELDNPADETGHRLLLNGLYADAHIAMETPRPVLAAPRSAVLQTGSRAVAYIDHGEGMYEQATLTLGLRGDRDVEILAGLSEGDRVVTEGNLLIDGQAEMNRAFATPEIHAPEHAPSQNFSEGQRKAVSTFLATVDAMGQALSADDLKKFNAVSESAMDQTAAFLDAAKNLTREFHMGEEEREKLDQASHFHGFDDLHSARTAFHSFSMATVAVLDALHHVIPIPDAQVFQCPMVDDVLPGVDPKAFWVQLGDRQLANPYFGAEMLRCGSKVANR